MKKKLLSTILSMSMIFSVMSNVKAEETTVYSYIKDGEQVNITQQDLNAGNWNTDCMSHMPIEQYEDFPMMLDKNVTGKAELSIYCTYLKNVSESDDVTFSIVDRNSGDVPYVLKMLSLSYPDLYEPNNNERNATDLSLLTSPIKDATLPLSDKDYYKFTVGAGGAILNIGLESYCKEIQALTVYGQNNGILITGSLEQNEMRSRILDVELPGNETYIVTVLKKTNSGYCTGHPYKLS